VGRMKKTSPWRNTGMSRRKSWGIFSNEEVNRWAG
jgi:hypothetical protein